MSKYHKLVKQCKNHIDAIKQLRADADAAQEAGDCERWCELDDRANVLIEQLDEIVQAEYENVPYAKPRQAGIAGFWREAGIS